MKFTGERYVPNLDSPEISYEHWHRYLYSTQFVKEKTVLDIACGEGYGSYLLSQYAEKVIGVDVSQESIAHAASTYIVDNLEFRNGSAGRVPINGQSIFDVVVSFETIEHLSVEDQTAFLREVKRLLKPEGLFIVSTPNKLTYSDITNHKNEFHLNEFYINDFKEFLSSHFKNFKLMGQKIYPVSYIWNSDSIKSEMTEYRLECSEKGFRPSEDPKSMLYAIAVCSDRTLENPEASVLIDLSEKILKLKDSRISELEKMLRETVSQQDAQHALLNQNIVERDVQLALLNRDMVERDAQLVLLNHYIVERDVQLALLYHGIVEQDAQLALLNQDILERDAQLAAIQSSTSWRLTKPMRLFIDQIKRVWYLLRNPKSIYRIMRRHTRFVLERLPGGPLVVQACLRARRCHATWWEKRSADVPLALAALAKDRPSTLFADWHRQMVSACNTRFEDRDLPHITVSVVLYNSQKWLTPFAQALLGSDYPLNKVTLIFVDNGSTDGTVEHVNALIAEHGIFFHRIELIKCPNAGYGSGNHTAILKSVDDFVLVTNVDAEFDCKMLRILAQTAVSDAPDVACWEPMQVPHEHPKYYDPVTLLTNWCSHACVLLRRAAYLACGGYDKRIFMYGEDVELSFRLRSQGNKLRYVPNARILHHVDLDDSRMSSSKLILQISGSLAANALLRYRYGRWRDIWVGEVLLRVLKLKTMKDDARNQAARAAISIVHLHRLHFLFSRHRGDAYFPFIGVDFDLRREGSLHRRKFDCLVPALPRVSIITRTMKHRYWFLREAIASVINQTYPNIEHIIVEDGSSEFQSKITELRSSYPRDIRHLQSIRGGRSAAGNVGLEASTGEFVIFLDDDDLLFPDHVETLVEQLMATPEAIAAYSLSWSVHTDIEWQAESYREVLHEMIQGHKQPFDHDRLLVSNFASIQAVLFRRSAYEAAGGFHEDLHALEDWNLWCRFAMLGDFVLVEKLTSLYRVPAKINHSAERQKVLDTAYESVRGRNLEDRAKLAGL